MNSRNYVIVANGPFLSRALLQVAAQNACIVALDGAANQLLALNIMPEIILGDFDSFEDTPAFASIKKIRLPDQNFTDFQKALTWIKAASPARIDVVCATGGRMDHEQANLRALISAYSPTQPIYVHNGMQTLEFVANKTIHIQGQHGDYCGFFGMPRAHITVKNQGLHYLQQDIPYELTLTQSSVSNRLQGNAGAVVEIVGEAWVVHPPMLVTFKTDKAEDSR